MGRRDSGGPLEMLERPQVLLVPGATCRMAWKFMRLMSWGCWMLTGVTMPSTQILSFSMPISLAA